MEFQKADKDLCESDNIKAIPNAWMQYMRAGDFEQAWKLSECVLKAGANRDYNLPRHFQCIWDGTPLHGKRVLVRCYHGLGDTLQFIRYAALIKQIASQVIVWAQPELIMLLENVEGIDMLLPLHNGTPDVAYDVDVEVMELPFIFRTTLNSIPLKVPYLYVEPMRFSPQKEKLGVGLVWQAGDWDQARCIPFSWLKPLTEIAGINIYILQYNAASAGWQEGCGIYPGKFSLYDYARVIKGLDLLITVDSMPAHLAGALNVPVWTMLHTGADWRWMDNRSDSPWYPSMKLFRQEKPGDWEAVILKVAAALRDLVL